MENLNGIKFFEVERPKIPQVLLDATYDSMRGGAKKKDSISGRLNDAETQKRTGVRELKNKRVNKQEQRSRRSRKKKVEDDEEPDEPTYRAHGERRMSLLVIGDQHRFGHGGGKKGLESYLYPDAPPIDFSFCLLSNIEEIITSQEPPNTKRNYKVPEKTEDDRYKTSSVRLSYNLLENIEGLVGVLYKILDGGPLGLRWIDLSFNHIHALDEDMIAQIPNVKILYLHGNALADMTEIVKLQGLPVLHTLTLHGNPIEEEDGYRACMIHYLPELKHLDFIAVTKGDFANAKKYGVSLEPYWQKRHHELENQSILLKAANEISYTEQLMKEEMKDDDNYEDTDFKALNLE